MSYFRSKQEQICKYSFDPSASTRLASSKKFAFLRVLCHWTARRFKFTYHRGFTPAVALSSAFALSFLRESGWIGSKDGSGKNAKYVDARAALGERR